MAFHLNHVVLFYNISVDLYLNVTRQSRGLYHESYKNVAVMFASVVNYDSEGMNDNNLLKIMNQIIGDFDKVNSLCYLHLSFYFL